jgi:hypothetical protein
MPDIAGLKLIVPTSVAGSGVSVSASGKVTFTAATSVSVNGVFSSTYDNYLVVFRASATGDVSLLNRLRLSGTDATATNYTNQRLYADNTTVVGARATSQSFLASGYLSNTARNGVHLYLYGPALAQPTASRAVSASGYAGGYIQDEAGTHSLSTAYDGMTLYIASQNMTGSLTIYGLAN